jgi:hypothetical protein
MREEKGVDVGVPFSFVYGSFGCKIGRELPIHVSEVGRCLSIVENTSNTSNRGTRCKCSFPFRFVGHSLSFQTLLTLASHSCLSPLNFTGYLTLPSDTNGR